MAENAFGWWGASRSEILPAVYCIDITCRDKVTYVLLAVQGAPTIFEHPCNIIK